LLHATSFGRRFRSRPKPTDPTGKIAAGEYRLPQGARAHLPTG
jgi:hypothetical protein